MGLHALEITLLDTTEGRVSQHVLRKIVKQEVAFIPEIYKQRGPSSYCKKESMFLSTILLEIVKNGAENCYH